MPNTQKNSVRRDYIDVMKGLGILLVVLGHFMEQYRINFQPIGATFICIYLFHMALFCICSGLVAHFSLWKLVTQQIWLYAVGQAIMLVFRAVILREDFAASGGVLLAFLLPWRHMWYLYALIFWHLTLPLLTRLREKGLPFALLGLAGAVALGLWAGNIDWPFTLVRVFAYYPFYAFGVLFRPQIDRLDELAKSSKVMRWAPGLAFAVCYGLYFRSLMLQDGPLSESARIFNDVPYSDVYAMSDRAKFYAIGIISSLALVAALGGCKCFAGLGKKTLTVYLFHMPIYAFYSEMGFFQLAHEKPLPVTVAFVLLEALGTLCLLASEPVNKTFNAIANVWYKMRKKER